MSSFLAPPGPDVSIAPRLIAITGTLYFVIIVLYAVRMYSRVRPTLNLWWDDLTISAALLIGLTGWSITLGSISYGFGRHNFYVPPDDRVTAARLQFISQPFWAWSTGMAKVSMGFMLLRIKRTKNWQIFLYSMIALSIILAIDINCCQFLQCRPIAAIWDPAIPNSKCWSPQTTQATIYFNATMFVLMDITFSLLPVTFIKTLDRPRWEKFLIACLMGLGLVATAASIVKSTLVKTYGKTGDTLWDVVDMSLWCKLEEQFGIIAACVPCLKAPIERVLRRMGVVTSHVGEMSPESSWYAPSNENQNHEVHVPSEYGRPPSEKTVGASSRETKETSSTLMKETSRNPLDKM